MKRRSKGRFKRPKRRADWVYRSSGHIESTAGAGVDLLGTYDSNVLNHTSGTAASQGHILYDSQNYLRTPVRETFGGVLSHIPRAARAEGRKPTILAVEGIVYWEPSTWALGSLMAIGMRLGVFEQDPGSGNVLLDPEYSMWNDGPYAAGGSLSKVVDWANNGRNNTWERRIHYGFSDNSVFTVVRVRWRGRRSLLANECFALYTELEGTSVDTRTQYWLRTLVADEA